MSKFIKLAKIADVITGFPFKGDQYSNSGIRTVRGENVTEGSLRWDTIKCWDQEFEKEEDYLLKADDVVIGMDGSKVGKNKARVKENDLPLLLAQRVACVRAKKGNDQVFLYYLINNPRFERYVFQTQTGSSVPHISKSQIEEYEVPNFDYLSQQKIASVLSALDDKIELNNRINAELEAMAKLVYEYWFVQFDFPFDGAQGKPVVSLSACAERSRSRVEGYKSSGGKMVWNEELKREVPEGWEVGFLENLAKFNPSQKLERESLAPYLGMSSIPTNCYMTEMPEEKEFSGGIKFQNGDIVVARITPCLENGKTALITLLEDNSVGFGSTEFIVIRARERSTRSFLTILSRSESFRNFAISKMTGTSGRKRVDAKELAKFQMAIPPNDLLKKYAAIVDSYFEKMTINTKQNQELASLRDWLLPMLMNGQVRIDELSHHDELSDLVVEEELGMVAEREREKYGEGKLDIPDNRKGFAKQVLAGKIVSTFKDDPAFTPIKFQKIQFLAEHLIEADLNLNYYYQAAGPYDNRFMHTIYTDFLKQKWFNCQNKRFIPLEKQGKIEGYYQGYFAPAQKQLDRLFELLYPMSEAEAEIIATAYAVWNNRIIEGRTVEDGELVEDFYLWSDRKRQYSKEQISSGLKWLRNNHMEPRGFGKLIKRAKFDK
jgi:type I restriction enzyme S subunit